MSFRHYFARVLAGASVAALSAVATPASAQRVDNIVAFGDSYADQDNALQLGLIPPAFQPLYPTGRFSGGSNYIDTLAQILNVPVENFAIGGARANPDFLFEVNTFLSGGGGPVFPTVSGEFDEGDLLTVSIGGNDARAYGSSVGASVAGAPAAAAPAIAAATTGLDALVAAGAPTISFLAGDTGRLPEVAPFPAQAAIRSAYSAAFNAGMQSTLAGYAADGVVVHYLDLNLLLDNVIANPDSYGITKGLVCPFFPDPTCIVDSTGYLIYGDGLHLTSTGFAIIARYVAAQLTAPLTLQAPSDVGLDTARQFGRTLAFRTDLGGRTRAPGLHAFITGDAFSRDVGRSATNDPFDVDGVGVTAGVEMGLGAGVAGIAANYSRPRARFGNDTFRDTGRSYQIGAYAGAALGPIFGQAHVGYGRDKHRLSRTGVVDNLAARPDGSHVLAGAKAGYLIPFGPLGIGPVVALDYAKAKVDGYTEQGDPALTLKVSNVSYKALTGSVGLELRGGVGVPGATIRPYASAMLEKDLIGDGRTIFASQTSAPLIVNRFEYPDRSTKAYGRLSGGLAASLLGGLDIQAGASATVGKKQGNEVSANVGLRLGL